MFEGSENNPVDPVDATANKLAECRALAMSTFQINADAVASLAGRLDAQFDRTMAIILEASGRVIVSGIGKSGHIGRKVSATMASLGTPSQFVHSTEAMHGDFGMIVPGDVVILISQSGETEEVVRLIPFLRRNGHAIIGITGNPTSRLARHADAVLSTEVEREACPMNLAPTTSTMMALALGDALAIALGHATDFRPTDFAQRHPGGKLGERLMMEVRRVMTTTGLPTCAPETPVRDVLGIVTAGGRGLVLVLENTRLAGIITDGDLRRAMSRGLLDSHVASDVMTATPITIAPDATRFDADELMRAKKITALAVTDANGSLLGLVGIHD